MKKKSNFYRLPLARTGGPKNAPFLRMDLIYGPQLLRSGRTINKMEKKNAVINSGGARISRLRQRIRLKFGTLTHT